MRTHSIWLSAIIVLTVIAFLAVFQPIRFSPRKDPSDSTKYLEPVGAKNFNAGATPDPTTTLGRSLNVYVYPPQSDLRLGLDLKGGMRVVLQIPDHADFKYNLTKTFDKGDKDKLLDFIQQYKSKLTDAATKEFDGTMPPQSTIFLDYTENKAEKNYAVTVEVTTYPQTIVEAEHQFANLKTAMDTVFGVGNYTMPKGHDTADAAYIKVTKELQDQTRDILERRVNPDGTKEITSYNQGTNQVVLEIPGERDPDHVRELLGKTANLDFFILAPEVRVHENNADTGAKVVINRGSEEVTSTDALKDALPALHGSDIKPNSVGIVPDTEHQGMWAVTFDVKSEASSNFGDLTDRYSARTLGGEGHGRLMAIVLDNEIKSAPQILEKLSGGVRITGNFTEKEAKDLKTLLDAGALQVPVKIVENRTVSPTLGADSVSMSLTAGLFGLAAVLIFMVAYYRLPGLMASCALVVYIFLSLFVMWSFPAFTLSLPGIAGIIISIGMAVDANVIIFERLKEELRAKKPLETAIDTAFKRAWTAILDSNIASIITGSVLYWLGTGAVRGFAVTLLIGVIVSLFTAVTVTRLFLKLMIRSKVGHKLSAYGL